MTNTTIFTPMLMEGETYDGETMDDGRAKMEISAEDSERFVKAQPERGFRTNPQWVKVTDLSTDSQWMVRPASCGADCYCGAEAKRVTRDARASELVPGNTYREYGMDDWHLLGKVDWHGDTMLPFDAEGNELSALDCDTVVEVRA